MDYYLILGLGMVAQALFAARFIVQLTKSELAGKVVSPIVFWQLSLLASLLLVIYGFLRNDIVIIGGQAVTYYIYIRNLQLKNNWNKFPHFLRSTFLILPVLFLLGLLIFSFKSIDGLLHNPDIPVMLLTFGTIGQVIFTIRFVVQWIHSEKMKESEFPLSFWIISLLGSLLIIGYAIMRKDAVLFVGHFFGTIIYSRNLILHYSTEPATKKQYLSVTEIIKKHRLLFISILAAIALLANINDWSVTETTEARYAQISKEMVESGDYLHPTLMGIQHYHKPPLTYWVTAVGYKIFGVNVVGARFFLQMGIILQMLIVYGIARLLLKDDRQAFLSAVLYFSLPGIYMSSRALTTDVYLTTFVLISALSWLKFAIQHKKAYLLLFYFSMGLGFFTKGPVVFIFPLFIILGTYIGGLKPKKSIIHHITGVIIMLAIGLSWFIYLYIQDARFFDYFVIRHTVERLTADVFSRNEPWWYYLAIVPALSFPWLFVLSVRIFQLKHFKMTNGIIILMWIIPPLFFFSLSQSKLLLYVLPVYAAIAIGAIWMWFTMTNKSQKVWSRIQFVFHLIILGSMAIAPVFSDLIYSLYIYFFLIITATILISIKFLPIKITEKPILAAAIFMYGIALITPYIFMENPKRVKDTRYVAAFIEEKLPDTNHILVYNRRLPSMLFNTDFNVISLYDGRRSLDRNVWFEKDDTWKDNLKNLVLEPKQFERLSAPGNVLLVRERDTLAPHFLEKAKVYDHKTVIDGWKIYYFETRQGF